MCATHGLVLQERASSFRKGGAVVALELWRSGPAISVNRIPPFVPTVIASQIEGIWISTDVGDVSISPITIAEEQIIPTRNAVWIVDVLRPTANAANWAHGFICSAWTVVVSVALRLIASRYTHGCTDANRWNNETAGAARSDNRSAISVGATAAAATLLPTHFEPFPLRQ